MPSQYFALCLVPLLFISTPGMAQQSKPYNLTGATSSHPENHFATSFTMSGTTTAAVAYFLQTGGQALGINDMSLVSGGLFDVNHDWKPPHNLHRVGRSVDIDRCATAATGLVLANQILLDKLMLKRGGVRIVEPPPKNQPIPPCAQIPIKRMHYEFSQ